MLNRSRIVVNAFKRLMGNGSEQDHIRWADFIKETMVSTCISAPENLNVDVYNMEGESQNHLPPSATNQRLVIFGYSTRSSNQPMWKDKENGILNPTGRPDSIYFTRNEQVIAEFLPDTFEINILIDLFKEFNEENKSIFTKLMKIIEENVFKPLQHQNSWKYTNNRQRLENQLKESIIRQKTRQIEKDKAELIEIESKIRDMTQRMKQYYDKTIHLRNSIESQQNSIENTNDYITRELDNIVNHHKIEDLVIKDGKYIISTVPLYGYDRDNNRYYFGKYKIEIKIDQADVRFRGDNPRQGYWTSNDPHPHVNGATGEACLGNVASTIAELCSQNEIYALALVCIDFLESVNIGDVAGRMVRNWDKVDDDGKIISDATEVEEEDEGEYEECEYCGENVHVTDITIAYNDLYEMVNDDGEIYYEVENPTHVCDTCINNHYYYNEDVGCYISNEA